MYAIFKQPVSSPPRSNRSTSPTSPSKSSPTPPSAKPCTTATAPASAKKKSKKNIETTSAAIEKRLNAGDGFTSSFKSLYTNLKDKVSSTEATAEGAAIENISILADANQLKCLQSLERLIHGSICYLTSGNADQKTTVSGNDFNLTILDSSSRTEIENCYYIFDAVCLIRYGVSISTNITQTYDSKIDTTGPYRQACLDAQKKYTCFNTTCKNEVLDLFLTEMVHPWDHSFFPTLTYYDKFTNTLD